MFLQYLVVLVLLFLEVLSLYRFRRVHETYHLLVQFFRLYLLSTDIKFIIMSVQTYNIIIIDLAVFVFIRIVLIIIKVQFQIFQFPIMFQKLYYFLDTSIIHEYHDILVIFLPNQLYELTSVQNMDLIISQQI